MLIQHLKHCSLVDLPQQKHLTDAVQHGAEQITEDLHGCVTIENTGVKNV